MVEIKVEYGVCCDLVSIAACLFFAEIFLDLLCADFLFIRWR